jgi:hypothetical protein
MNHLKTKRIGKKPQFKVKVASYSLLPVSPIVIPPASTRDLVDMWLIQLPQFSRGQIQTAVTNIIRRGDLPNREMVISEIDRLVG